ncbi:MAG: hypothetical protein U5L72_08450 [Bacteroidales bacterium]|nr:hypothetical protein [Bacteroidales bacterium]
MITPLSQSWTAPASISLAEADPWWISTATLALVGEPEGVDLYSCLDV